MSDNDREYTGFSRRTRYATAIILTPLCLCFALVLVETWLPWYARLSVLLIGLMAAVYPADHRLRRKIRGNELTFHHFFELPAFFFFGIFAGHDLPWFGVFIVVGILAVILVPLDFGFGKTHNVPTTSLDSILTLGYFSVPLFLGFAVGLIVLLL